MKGIIMADFAVIENNVIVNVIVAETKEIAEKVTGKLCVVLPPLNVGIGWTYEGGTFTAPVVEAPKNADTKPTA
jgi:creatinine amidohydrolase/Fe(II)-dependent formamide hydrolase-like protein